MIDNKLYLDDFKPIVKYNVMEEFSDLRDCRKQHKEISLWKWLEEFHKADCCYIYNKHDKMPFYRELWQILKRKL